MGRVTSTRGIPPELPHLFVLSLFLIARIAVSDDSTPRPFGRTASTPAPTCPIDGSPALIADLCINSSPVTSPDLHHLNRLPDTPPYTSPDLHRLNWLPDGSTSTSTGVLQCPDGHLCASPVTSPDLDTSLPIALPARDFYHPFRTHTTPPPSLPSSSLTLPSHIFTPPSPLRLRDVLLIPTRPRPSPLPNVRHRTSRPEHRPHNHDICPIPCPFSAPVAPSGNTCPRRNVADTRHLHIRHPSAAVTPQHPLNPVALHLPYHHLDPRFHFAAAILDAGPTSPRSYRLYDRRRRRRWHSSSGGLRRTPPFGDSGIGVTLFIAVLVAASAPSAPLLWHLVAWWGRPGGTCHARNCAVVRRTATRRRAARPTALGRSTRRWRRPIRRRRPPVDADEPMVVDDGPAVAQAQVRRWASVGVQHLPYCATFSHHPPITTTQGGKAVIGQTSGEALRPGPGARVVAPRRTRLSAAVPSTRSYSAPPTTASATSATTASSVSRSSCSSPTTPASSSDTDFSLPSSATSLASSCSTDQRHRSPSSSSSSSSSSSVSSAASVPAVTKEWWQSQKAAGKRILDVIYTHILPAAFASGTSFQRFATDRGIPFPELSRGLRGMFSELMSEVVHEPVHMTTREGSEWTTQPVTFFCTSPRARLSQWLQLQHTRGFLRSLPPGTRRIQVVWYWDKGARTMAGYPVTLLMCSVPLLFKRPASIRAVFPLVAHAGPRPYFEAGVPAIPARPAKDGKPAVRAKPAKKGKPAVAERVDTIVAQALNSITSISVPVECLPPELRAIVPDGSSTFDLPVEIINGSDQAAVSETSPDVAAGQTIQFPAKFSQPEKKKFNNSLHSRPSAECNCTAAQQLLPNTVCATCRRETVCFFRGPTVAPVVCRRLYLRHALIHGHPAVDADIACYLYRSNLKREAEFMCTALPAPYDALKHVRERPVEPVIPRAGPDPVPEGAGAREPGGTNPERPSWVVRLSYVTDQLRAADIRGTICQNPDGSLCMAPRRFGKRGRLVASPRPTLADIHCMLRTRTGHLSFPLPTGGLSRFARRDPDARDGFYTVAQHHLDAVNYSRYCLHPMDPRTPPAEEVAALGCDIFVRHKALLAVSVPWRAPAPRSGHAWFDRLCVEQPEQARTVHRIQFCANASCVAQSFHEWCLGASKAMVLYGKEFAERTNEEGFERVFLYWWMMVFVMGGLLASRIARLRYSIMLLIMAVWAGCPTTTRLQPSDFKHRAYQGRKRNRETATQEAPEDDDPRLDSGKGGQLPISDPARSPSPRRNPATTFEDEEWGDSHSGDMY